MSGLEILNWLLLMLAIAVSIPLLVFSLEVFLALWPRSTRRLDSGKFSGRAVILMPAHNEEAVIGDTLASLMPTLGPHCSVLVIADNCSDRTAQLAREAGAEVLERFNTELRGKGYALQSGLDHLTQNPPEIVLVIDADCQVDPELVQRLIAQVATTGQPAQAYAHFMAPAGTARLNAVSELALKFRGLIRPLGALRLGAPCQLYGTGMAFPWQALVDVPWGGDHLVEDLQFGIDLLLKGYRPRFCPEVSVRSDLPTTVAGFQSQRTRWEQGHLQVLTSQSPRLLWGALRQSSGALLWAALDLLVPPLALLVLVWLAVAALTCGAWSLGAGPLPLVVMGCSGTLLLLALLTGWWAFCRQEIPLRVLLSAPWYVARKVPMYLRILFRPERRWIRTPRDAAST
jgi:cellulose synthase/poly-beta-1,6-N-acetylglucosamine synthase-like glycosyltransferase